jgi:hypothetical protein
MSPVLANNYMGRRVNYTDRRKIRFDRRQESNGAQMLFQHLAKKIETMKILSIKRKRSTTERRGNGERRRSWVRYCKWCSIYAPSLD